jgi:hypothetical protein
MIQEVALTEENLNLFKTESSYNEVVKQKGLVQSTSTMMEEKKS